MKKNLIVASDANDWFKSNLLDKKQMGNNVLQ